MLISHRYRFIYIKTGKVGGTSLEIALSQFLGPDDVITPISWVDDLDRHQRGYRGPQNFGKALRDLQLGEYPRYLKAGIGSRFRRGENRFKSARRFPRKYWNHMPAEAIREAVPASIWQTYYKFAIERNPWDKVVSQFYWDPKKEKVNVAFRDYVLSGRSCKNNFPYYSIRGMVAVDRLLRYDQLSSELAELSRQLSLPENLHDTMRNVRAKGGYRKGADYRDHYDNETRRAVEIQYAREIAALGFRFGE